MYIRNTVLDELRENIAEICYVENGQHKIGRFTLKMEYMPLSYQQSIDEQKQEQDFHNVHQEMIVAWSLNEKTWKPIPIINVTYMQMVQTD